jgi:O-antigen/teichoic acid export membrane protein
MALLQSLKRQYSLPAVRSIGIYTITNFFIKGASFLLIPVFTNPAFLTAADNGLLTLFSQSLLFMMPFVSMGLLQTASVDFFKVDKKAFKDFCSTALLMSFSVSVVFMVVFWLLRNTLLTQFNVPVSFCFVVPLLSFFTFCYELLVMIIRNRNSPGGYMRVTVTKVLLDLGLAVILIVGFSLTWKGRVTSTILSAAAIAAFALYFLWKNNFLGTIKKSVLASELKYSLPLITLQLSNFCLFSSDTFFLAGITGNHSEVGIYGLASLFASIIFTLAISLLQHFVPKVNSALAHPDVDHASIRRQFNYYFLLLTSGSLVLLLLIPVIYRYFVNEAYSSGLSFIYLLCAGYYVWCITYFFYTFLFYNKQKGKLLFLSVTSIVISLCSNYFFVKNMGSMGAAISVCLSYLSVFIIVLCSTTSFWRPIFEKTNERL